MTPKRHKTQKSVLRKDSGLRTYQQLYALKGIKDMEQI
jgi:hypothetical protein